MAGRVPGSATSGSIGRASDKEAVVDDKHQVSMDEIEAETRSTFRTRRCCPLLDVNANVDLGLDLAAPVDLAAAANLNVAAPIEAAATANVLSPDGEAVGLAEQTGHIDQGISGGATANAPQHAGVSQGSSPSAVARRLVAMALGRAPARPSLPPARLPRPRRPNPRRRHRAIGRGRTGSAARWRASRTSRRRPTRRQAVPQLR